MNQLDRYNAYTPVVSERGELIENEFRQADILEQSIWAKTHIVAIVAIVALTYMVDSNNRRDIEIAKEHKKISIQEQKEVFNVRKFVGLDK